MKKLIFLSGAFVFSSFTKVVAADFTQPFPFTGQSYQNAAFQIRMLTSEEFQEKRIAAVENLMVIQQKYDQGLGTPQDHGQVVIETDFIHLSQILDPNWTLQSGIPQLDAAPFEKRRWASIMMNLEKLAASSNHQTRIIAGDVLEIIQKQHETNVAQEILISMEATQKLLNRIEIAFNKIKAELAVGTLEQYMDKVIRSHDAAMTDKTDSGKPSPQNIRNASTCLDIINLARFIKIGSLTLAEQQAARLCPKGFTALKLDLIERIGRSASIQMRQLASFLKANYQKSPTEGIQCFLDYHKALLKGFKTAFSRCFLSNQLPQLAPISEAARSLSLDEEFFRQLA